MAVLSEEIKSESPVLEDAGVETADSPSIYGSGDAMWSIDQSEVDVQQSYTVTRDNGSTYTREQNVLQPTATNSHGAHRDVENGTQASLHYEGGGYQKFNKAQKFTPKKEELVLGAGQAPSELSELGEVGTGASYTRATGTLEAPNVYPELVPDCLFINGTTHEADVIQNDIGDCYFLAALLGIIHSDPSFIPKMMSVHNGVVRTNFYHLEGEGEDAHWVQKPLETQYGVMSDHGRMHGCYYRIAYDPSQAAWSANVETNTLKVKRRDLYQAALWVNCIESAFSYYAHLYGQYGDRSQKPEDVEKRDGENEIDGGHAGRCLHMFFGEDVPNSNITEIRNHSREKSILENAAPLMKEFMKFSMTQDGSKTEDTHICIAAFKSDIGPRGRFYASTLIHEIDAALEDEMDAAKKADLEAAREALLDIDYLVAKYLGQQGVGGREGLKTGSEYEICNSLHECQLKLATNTTFTEAGFADYTSLRSALGTIIENKYNDIFIYQKHAYNVAHVDFRDKDGNPISVDNSTTFEEFAMLVDVDKSTVILENPHGQTKAVRPGQDRTRTAEGKFEATLREALASTTQFTSVVGHNHRHDGEDGAESIMNSAIMNSDSNRRTSTPSSKYDYWYSGGDPKGTLLNEDEVSIGGPKFEHATDHENLMTNQNIMVMLDKNNKVVRPQSELSSTTREIPGGKKYEVTDGVKSVSKPSPSELYKESNTGVEVEYFQGTINDPNLVSDIVPKCLFIDDTPQARDVMQGAIGDCYFLASVLHVLNAEPERIRGMMSIQGEEVDTVFYHKEGATWSPVHVRTKWGYTGLNQYGVLQQAGARVRVDDKPSGSPLWQAKIDESSKTLCVNKKAMYQAAMWVNLMENAYALFASKYGKYGKGVDDNKDRAATEEGFGRFANIHFGASQCLQLFFGSRADNHSTVDMSKSTKDSGLIKGNEAVFDALLALQATKTKMPTGNYYENKQSMVCAYINSETLLSRLKTLGKNVVKEAKSSKDSNVSAARSTLEEMVNFIKNEKALAKAGDSASGTSPEVTIALNQLNNYSVSLAQYNDALMSLPSWTLFRNATASMTSMTQNRFMMANHAYNVKSAQFYDKNGNPIDTTGMDAKSLMKVVDVTKSQVVMQNPHGNSPNYDPRTGDSQGYGEYGGEFTISVEEFMWSVGALGVSKSVYYSSN